MTSLIVGLISFGSFIHTLHYRCKLNEELLKSLQKTLQNLNPIIQKIRNENVINLEYNQRRFIEKKIDKLIRYIHLRLKKAWLTRMITCSNEAQKLSRIASEFLISLQVFQIGELQDLTHLVKDLPDRLSSDMERLLQKALEDQTNEIKEHISSAKRELLEELQQSIAKQNIDSERRLIKLLCPYINKVRSSKIFWKEFPLKSEVSFEEFFRAFNRVFLRKYQVSTEKLLLIEIVLRNYFKGKYIHQFEINCFFSSVWENKYSRKEFIRYESIIPDLVPKIYKIFFRALNASIPGRGIIQKGDLIEVSRE